jgi:hypothetical protein
VLAPVLREEVFPPQEVKGKRIETKPINNDFAFFKKEILHSC